MAAAPIPVASPPGGVTAGCPIILPASCAAVTSTLLFLDWQPAAAAPGGAAQVQLATFQAVKAFLPRCNVSRIPADLASASAVNVLCVRLTDARWSRILTELDAAQIFSRNRSTVEELHAAIKDAVFPNLPAWTLSPRIGVRRRTSCSQAAMARPRRLLDAT